MVRIVWRNGMGAVYADIDVKSNPEAVRETLINELESIGGELGSFGEIGDTITIEYE